MGLASAVLAYLTVRAIGGPPWLGVVPAAALALGGDELFVEHAALSEAPYVLLLSAMLYATVRAWRGSWRWALLAGLCAGLGVWDRGAGLALVPIVPLWLALCRRRPTRRTLAVAALSAAVALATVEGYIQWRHAASGLSGLTTNGNWNLYGRVAPWADCTRFSPPAGTEQLCQTAPPAQRGTVDAATYIFDASSPAQVQFGPPYEVSSDPYATSRLWEFSVSAIEGQPLDYLNAVWQDAIRLVDPNHPSDGNLSADQFIGFLLYGPDYHSGVNTFVSYWQGLEYPGDGPTYRGSIGPLHTWEEVTRLQGPLMVILLALALAAPWAAIGDARAGARLLALVTLALLLFPILTTGYDYRYVIPALGPLFATAALGGAGIHARVARRRAARASPRPADGTLAA
jgi:4-amino-4-deoxy-L-arabinose transferase-like glycosyltransferase